ncbi:MAG: exodeoxyribonuclease VII small subunit [Synechococcaceae bacterium WB8_1B_136]|nr:exodeoxyribonuclease VII small subunit [Synechococcaceae bacterium WB8_1B_136]
MTESPPRRSPRRRKNDTAAVPKADPADGHGSQEEWLADIQTLSFQEARTALELAMAQLQATDLEVEQMAGLYRRARAYADRCEAVLNTVEQEVIEWSSEAPTP